MDKQALIVTEVLTDVAKAIIQQHYLATAPNEGVDIVEESKIQSNNPDKDSSLLRSHINYSDNDPRRAIGHNIILETIQSKARQPRSAQ